MQSKVPFAVLCACWRCHVLIGSAGVICVGEKHGGREKLIEEKAKITVHNNTYYTCCAALCSKECTAQHNIAPQHRARRGTAPHGTARRCAALLGYIINSGTDLSWV